MQRSMAGQDWAMLAGLALVFGSAFFLMKLALGSYGPLTVALIRVALGCLILTAVAVWRGRRLPRGQRIWLTLLVMGALNNAIPFSPHLLGPDPYRERAGGDPECDDPDLHRAGRPCGGAGAADLAARWRASCSASWGWRC